jgi:VacB/RNase II family 3'-5' exoribonuclease
MTSIFTSAYRSRKASQTSNGRLVVRGMFAQQAFTISFGYTAQSMSKQSAQGHQPDLYAIARQTMIDAGFEPDFNRAVLDEVEAASEGARVAVAANIKDLRELLWSSIDNVTSRDLDQVEYAERLPSGDIRLLIGIADVDASVAKGSAIDKRAEQNCTSVYTGVKTFAMLPEELSTDLTSLVANEDRRAIVTEMVVGSDGSVKTTDIYPAKLRNRAKLSYEIIGAWLDGKSAVPEVVKSVAGLEAQLKLQQQVAQDLGELRKEHGAIELGTIQATPVVDDSGRVVELDVTEQNGARSDRGFHDCGQCWDGKVFGRQGWSITAPRRANAKILAAHRRNCC